MWAHWKSIFAVKLNKRWFGALALAMTLAVQGHSQVAAPATLPPCLIQYFQTPIGLGFTHLMLYNADGTCVEVSPNSSMSTFTYAVDPQNPAHGTITYSGALPFGNDQLYFTTANSGTDMPPYQVYPGGAAPIFNCYPMQTTNGGCNSSSLCQLDTGRTGTSGFVVQSTGRRWVLLRAVGASLGQFGVSPPVSSPSFMLYNSAQMVVGYSSVWSSDPNLVGGYQTIFSLLGAFPLKTGSDEGILLMSLTPGAYTAQFKAASAGTILFEAYLLPF
jgi:hypothetical protein